MIIRNDASSQFPFAFWDGRPMTEVRGQSSISPRIWQFYRLADAIADIHINFSKHWNL
jgi:hypothetical protein